MRTRICIAACLLLCGGCGDNISKYINGKFPPISVDAQRQTAVASAANALSLVTKPNLGSAILIKDIRASIPDKLLADNGVTKLKMDGDKQLVRIEADFSRKFTEADAGGSLEVAKLLREMAPSVTGTLTAFAGVSSGTAGPNDAEIQLQLLPIFKSIHIDKVTLAGEVDVTAVGDMLAALLNRYADNVTGQLSKSSSLKITLPAEFRGTFDPSKTIDLKSEAGQGTVAIKSGAISAPIRLLGLTWLVTDDQISALIEFVPVTPPANAEKVTVEPTYTEVEKRFLRLIKDEFDVPRSDSSTWVAVRKDLLAHVLNSVVAQSAICVSAVAQTTEQKASSKISFPDPGQIECSPDADCYSQRSCDVTGNHDTRNCSKCILYSPQICAFGGCIGGGGCITHGNDPICEAAKAAQNVLYDADKAARKLDCERLKLQDNAACEVTRAGKKTLCEAGKGVLTVLARDGNLANLDLSARAFTDGMKVCVKDFNLAADLSKAQVALDIHGSVKADVDLKFVPLNIAGHLACQFPWTERKTFAASLRDSKVVLESAVRFESDDQGGKLRLATGEKTIPMLLQPGPAEFLLTSVNMTLACQGLNLVKPLAISLTPFIKELRGEIDYKLKGQEMSVAMPKLEQRIGDGVVKATVKDTGKAFAAVATK